MAKVPNNDSDDPGFNNSLPERRVPTPKGIGPLPDSPSQVHPDQIGVFADRSFVGDAFLTSDQVAGGATAGGATAEHPTGGGGSQLHGARVEPGTIESISETLNPTIQAGAVLHAGGSAQVEVSARGDATVIRREDVINDLLHRVEYLEAIVRAGRHALQPPVGPGPGHNRPPLFPGAPELDDDIDDLIQLLRSEPTPRPSAINDQIKEVPEKLSKLQEKVSEYADEAGKNYAKGIGSGGAALTYAAIGYALHQLWAAFQPFLAMIP